MDCFYSCGYGCHWLKGLRTDMIREASQGDEAHPLETVGTPMVDSDAPVTIVTQDNPTHERVLRHLGADGGSGEAKGDLMALAVRFPKTSRDHSVCTYRCLLAGTKSKHCREHRTKNAAKGLSAMKRTSCASWVESCRPSKNKSALLSPLAQATEITTQGMDLQQWHSEAVLKARTGCASLTLACKNAQFHGFCS